MRNLRAMRRVLAAPMAVIFLLASVPSGPVAARLVGTEEILAGEAAASERARIAAFLERQDVRAQFEALGVDPAEAAARVASLSDDEVRELYGRLDSLPAGQGAFEAAIVAVIALFLLLIVTDLLGYTDIFPFIKPQTTPNRPAARR